MPCGVRRAVNSSPEISFSQPDILRQYIYGYKIDLDDATQNLLMIFLGVMFGVNAATAALAKLAAANAAKIGARVAAKPLSKFAIFNIAKRF